jgi:hypothetical protein
MQKARCQQRQTEACRHLQLLVGAWFQVLFHSPSGVLFTFPSRYWFTIGRRKIFSLGRWSSRIPAGFPVSRGTWEHRQKIHRFGVRGYHPLWPDFPNRSANDEFCNSHNARQLYHTTGLGCSPFARRYLGNRGCFLFLRLLRCFSSPRSLPWPYVFRPGYRRFTRGGFPHSEIPGSKLVCSSPGLNAAYHVLHRSPTPRHPHMRP